MLVGATPEESREVASHVPRCGVNGATTHRHHLIIRDRLGSIGPKVVSRHEVRLHALGSDEIRTGHAEGLEDVLAKVAVQRLPTHIFDNLAKRGEPVVAVAEPGARLGVDA